MSKIPPSFVLPDVLDDLDVNAIKAMNKGTASEQQQQRAMRFIIEKLCLTYDWPYRPSPTGDTNETHVALGRMFVGQQIVRIIKLPGKTLERLVAEEDAALTPKSPLNRKPRNRK